MLNKNSRKIQSANKRDMRMRYKEIWRERRKVILGKSHRKKRHSKNTLIMKLL